MQLAWNVILIPRSTVGRDGHNNSFSPVAAPPHSAERIVLFLQIGQFPLNCGFLTRLKPQGAEYFNLACLFYPTPFNMRGRQNKVL